MNEKVNTFFENLDNWHQELTELRKLILTTGLEEAYKWKVPCYTDRGKNIVLIHGFKEYCAIMFMNGALLSDPHQILVQPTENSQYGRQLRFTSLKEIQGQEAEIKAYIYEAIELEREGKKVEKKALEDYSFPEELKEVFETDPAYQLAFSKLTPGRQKGYLFHFSGAKQAKTKLARIEKNRTRIINGFGLQDCICGLSKRMPNCDGSHKRT